jgi:imidazolonepropionase-like amidohydrolase
MRRLLHRPLFICFLLVLGVQRLAVVLQGQEPNVVVIEGGTLIDGNGGPPVADALILIRGNRIETVSRKGQASYPANAQVLHADGKFILPGLADAHTHYQWWMPELMLHYGVTTVYDIAGSGQWGMAQREAINRGKVVGPRLFTMFQSLLDAWPGLRVVGVESPVTVEKAREVVRRNVEAKSDLFNLRRGLTLAVFKTAIEEAHKAGLPVVAQAIGPEVYGKEAVLAGADILEHSAGLNVSVSKDPSKWKGWGEDEIHSLDPTPWADMDDKKAEEMIKLLVDRKVSLEPDLIAEGRAMQKRRGDFELEDRVLYQNPLLAYVPEDRRLKELFVYRELDDLEPAKLELRQKGFQNFMRFIGQYARAGGNLLVGDDTSSWAIPGTGVHHELQILVEDVGLTPMQAIQSATQHPARAFRVLDRVGTVEPGKFADLLIVSDDPLQNIRNLQKIEWVIRDGQVANRTFHPWFKNPLRNSYGGSVEGRDWVVALKQATEAGIRAPSGLADSTHSFGQPCPGIDSISPTLVTAGDPAVTLTIKGVNFTSKSLVYVDGHIVPARLVSESELRATIDANLIANPETLVIKVKNPGLQEQPVWGDTSNAALLLVNFKY